MDSPAPEPNGPASQSLNTVVSSLLSKVGNSTGRDYFESLVSGISEALNVDFVVLGIIDKQTNTATTSAVACKGKVIENFSYDLKGAPCDDVVDNGYCIYRDEVAEKFPEDQMLVDLNIVSYAGYPLKSSAGEAMGILSVMDTRPMETENEIFELLELMAARAASELERDRKEKLLRHTLEMAEEASQAKSQFLATVSHEFRTPLNAVIGFAEEILKEDARSMNVESVHESAHYIKDAGRHLLAIVGDIIDLQRAERRQFNLHEEQIDVPRAIRGCVALMSERAAAKDITLQYHESAGALVLQADATRLRQVLINLITNSIKFTDEDGNIDLFADRTDDNGLKITVQDNGQGMDEEQLEWVKLPFTQLSNGHNRAHDGIGLGLAIGTSLMEQHGGSLTIASELGAGTSVSLIFPAERIGNFAASNPAKVRDETLEPIA